MKRLSLSLLLSFWCVCAFAFAQNTNCDSTFFIFKTMKLVGIDRNSDFPNELKNVKKECFLNILDSVTKTNSYQITHAIAMYYNFIAPNAVKDPFIDKMDSAILAKISYGLANDDIEMSETYYRYFDITGQLQWILEHDSLSRLAFQQYVMNRNGAVKDRITFLSCLIGDTTSFWVIYKNIKEERKNDGDALKFLLHCGMEYFGYYSLFVENAELLSDLGWVSTVRYVLCNIISEKYSYDIAKKAYSKLVLNEKLMRSYSVCDGRNMIMSVFNYDFYRGISVFYPDIAKSDEYVNSCYSDFIKKGYVTESTCEFDRRLYNLLVKAIKAEYKDLK